MLEVKGFSLSVNWHVLISFQLVCKSLRTNSTIVIKYRGFFMFSFDVPFKYKRWYKADCTKLTIEAFGLVVAWHVIITFRLILEVFGTNRTPQNCQKIIGRVRRAVPTQTQNLLFPKQQDYWPFVFYFNSLRGSWNISTMDRFDMVF